MSPWEKRLEQDRKEIFAEDKRRRAAAIQKRLSAIADLDARCKRVVDARQLDGQPRKRNFFPSLLHDFVASSDAMWGVFPGAKPDAYQFAAWMAQVINRESAPVRVRREGVTIYLERA